MKKLLVTLLKVGLSLGILALLVWDAQKDPKGLNRLRNDPKNWWLLAGAFAVCTAAVTLTLIRWWYLVRALDVPLRFRSALRIGFLGYLFNLAPMGIVGGDLLKGWMLDRQHRGSPAKAFASVVADRTIGLYVLFVVVSVAMLLCGYWSHPDLELRSVCRLTLLVTAVSTLCIAAVLTPGLTNGRGTGALGRLPYVGTPLKSFIEALRMYRQQPRVLIAAVVMTVGVHSLFTTGIFLIALGLPGRYVSLGEHFVVAPLSAAASIIPLPAGPQEGAIQWLYGQILGAPAKAKGLVMGLTYRLITVLIAAVGVCYYLGSRREVAEVIHKAEHQQPADPEHQS